jgi:hypothetical protein
MQLQNRRTIAYERGNGLQFILRALSWTRRFFTFVAMTHVTVHALRFLDSTGFFRQSYAKDPNWRWAVKLFGRAIFQGAAKASGNEIRRHSLSKRSSKKAQGSHKIARALRLVHIIAFSLSRFATM